MHPTPCPHLPEAPEAMDWRDLNRFGAERGADFYLTALRYSQYLWLRGLPARAVLALDRALFADVPPAEPVLARWPLPYPALRWMLANHRGRGFLGNPRVSFQHLAGRLRGDRAEVRRWRAWACWHITRTTLPQLPGDPKHDVAVPKRDKVAAGLEAHGHPGEAEAWAELLRTGRTGDLY